MYFSEKVSGRSAIYQYVGEVEQFLQHKISENIWTYIEVCWWLLLALMYSHFASLSQMTVLASPSPAHCPSVSSLQARVTPRHLLGLFWTGGDNYNGPAHMLGI